MTEQFDWKMALIREKELRSSSDIEGLLKINLEFLDNIRAGFMLELRFPRICYYYGRLKRTKELTSFVNKNSMVIDLFISQKLKEVSRILLDIGISFPNLSPSQHSALEILYCDPTYFDLIDDLMFDEHLLSQPLKKYDYSARQIRHANFSKVLKMEVFKAYLHNMDMVFDIFENGEFYYFYNRKENNVIRKESRDKFETKVEFLIDFPDLDIKKFGIFVKKLLGKEFFDFYSLDPIDTKENLEMAGKYTFDNEAYSSYQKRILLFPEKLNPELITLIEENIANEWLVEINK